MPAERREEGVSFDVLRECEKTNDSRDVEDTHGLSSTEGGEGTPRQIEARVVVALNFRKKGEKKNRKSVNFNFVRDTCKFKDSTHSWTTIGTVDGEASRRRYKMARVSFEYYKVEARSWNLHKGVDALSSVRSGDGNVFAAVGSSLVSSGRESDEESVVRVDVSTVTISRKKNGFAMIVSPEPQE